MDFYAKFVDEVKASDLKMAMLCGLAAYGALKASCCTLRNSYSFAQYVLMPRLNLRKRFGGGWAMITGASDGLGRAYAMELAKAGFNIILVARSPEKMEKVAQEIRDLHMV